MMCRSNVIKVQAVGEIKPEVQLGIINVYVDEDDDEDQGPENLKVLPQGDRQEGSSHYQPPNIDTIRHNDLEFDL